MAVSDGGHENVNRAPGAVRRCPFIPYHPVITPAGVLVFASATATHVQDLTYPLLPPLCSHHCGILHRPFKFRREQLSIVGGCLVDSFPWRFVDPVVAAGALGGVSFPICIHKVTAD